MNTANKLTLLRVVMIPAFLLVLYLDIPGAIYGPALQSGDGFRQVHGPSGG